MSTLFETFYDSLMHEMHINEMIMGCTSGGIIYGHIIDMYKDNKGNDKFVIAPDIGYSNNLANKLKKRYTINWNNVYQIRIKRPK